MNNEERDKFLTEAIGECWHHEGETVADAKHYVDFYICSKCHKTWKYRVDFSTWKGLGKLWPWAQKQEWWKTFIYEGYTHPSKNVGSEVQMTIFIDPDRFANAVYEFLKEEH